MPRCMSNAPHVFAVAREHVCISQEGHDDVVHGAGHLVRWQAEARSQQSVDEMRHGKAEITEALVATPAPHTMVTQR